MQHDRKRKADQEEYHSEEKHSRVKNPILYHAHCGVCQCLLHNRAVLPCAHVCCSECLVKICDGHTCQCPFCRANHQLHTLPLPDLVFRALLEHAIASDGDDATKEEWRQQKLRCAVFHLTTADGVKFDYSGEIGRHGNPEGQGTATYPGAYTYDGQWKAGQREGYGECNNLVTKRYFMGQWKANKREGRGKLTYSEGTIYDGEWRADKKEGRGKLTCLDGSSYEGEWKADKRDGKR